MVTGAFLVGFVQRLGGGDLAVNVLSAIPSLVGLLQIPGAIWGRSFSSYKRFVLPGGAGWRIFYLPLLFLPLAPISSDAKLIILTLSIGLASCCGTFVNPVYNDWIAEMVPQQSRGFYFARRNAIAAAVAAVVGIVGALLLDAFRSRGHEMSGFTVVYGIAFACTGLSMFFFLRMQDIPREDPIRQNLVDGIRAIGQPFRDAKFRRILRFLAFSLTGQMFAGNLFVAFARETLHLNYGVIQGTAVAMAVGNVAAAGAWGFLSDKYGNKPILTIVGAALALNPIPWILCIPEHNFYNAVLLLSTHVLMGVIWCGINLCQFNLLLATAPPRDRGSYIAAGLTVVTVAGGIAPILGGVMMQAMRPHFPVEIAYKLVFGTSILLRVIGVMSLLRVDEGGSTDVRTTLKTLGGLSIRGVRAMRTLSRTTDSESRESAIARVGTERVALAADELIKALHDPMPRVRRQAAAALAKLNDPRAADELVHQLVEHPDLVEEETVEALGELGDPAAVPILVSTLSSPRSLLRRSAARALGRLLSEAPSAAEQAMPALLDAAADAHDPDLRRAALQALRLIGDPVASEVIAGALLDPLPSVRIAAAEAVADLKLVAASDSLRESLARFQDEASAEVAYALGAVGDASDLPALLEEAARSVSVITRRRCLLGVARVLGAEPLAYRLMLTEGMARDAALLDLLRPLSKRQPAVRKALAAVGTGDEIEAVRALAQIRPELVPLVDAAVPERMLVAIARIVGTSSARRDSVR